MESRVRAKNFTDTEINLLVELVHSKRNILACKEPGLITNSQKLRAWEAIAVEFNARSGTYRRPSKVLREKWRNLKREVAKSRRHSTDSTYEIIKATNTANFDFIFRNVLGEQFTTGTSECDSEIVFKKEHDDLEDEAMSEEITSFEEIDDTESHINGVDPEHKEITIDEPTNRIAIQEDHGGLQNAIPDKPVATGINKEIDATISEANWMNFTPIMLKTSTDKVMDPIKKSKQFNGSMTREKWCAMVDKKLEIVLLKKQKLQQELSFQKDLHEQEIQFRRELHKQTLRHKEEEHQLKLKLIERNYKNENQ